MDLKQRLKKNEDFKKVLDNRKVLNSNSVRVFYLKNKEQENYRFGISVGKKVGNAVKRNYYKRIIRSVINKYPENLFNHDVVIIAKQQITSMTFEEIQKELFAIFDTIHNKGNN